MFCTFLLGKQLRQIGGWTSVNLVTLTCGSWSVGQHDPYFTIQWFCLISWWLFDVWTPHFGIMSQYNLTCDLKIFHGPVILHCILKIAWCMNILLRNYETVWPDVWPKNKRRSLWSIFHGPVILPYILKTIWCVNSIFWDYESVRHDIWTQNKCRSLWPIFHGPVFCPYILKTIWYMNTILLDYESVWPNVWPQNICSTLWPIFHGPVLLPSILKIIQWLNIILWDYESVWPDMWPPNISWSTEFALNLEDCLMYEYHTFGLWVSMTRHLTSK